MYLSRVEYYRVDGVPFRVQMMDEENTKALCDSCYVADDERSFTTFFAVDHESYVPDGLPYYALQGLFIYAFPRGDIRAEMRLNAAKAYRKELFAKLTNSAGRKFAILPSHGRAAVDENPDEMGPNGPNIYVDWVHFTYLTDMTYGLIENGEDNAYGAERPEARVMYLEDDCLVIDDGETKMYYGDFEIVPIADTDVSK